MSGITNWAEALIDPRFWVCYYGLPDEVYSTVLGLSERDINPFFYQLMDCADHPELLESDEAYELLDGSVIRLPFPDDFNWAISMGPEGTLHIIDHPTISPNGELIAEISGNEQWPGLRWPEALQIARCLRGRWTADFPVEAVLPLLTPVIGLSFDDVVDEARETLSAAWSTLGVIPTEQLEQWLYYIEQWELQSNIKVGWEWRPVTGWINSTTYSPRRHSSLPFEAFFTMLDRY